MTSFQMKYLQSGDKILDLPQTNIPEFAVVGRSNVGKSSLLNLLAGQKQLARTSKNPGRTRKINIFSVNNDSFYMVDLPGYGFAQSSKELKSHWAQNMTEYFAKRKNLFCVLFLVDSRRDIVEEDKELSIWFQQLGLKIIGVQTKCDKIHKRDLKKRKEEQAKGLLLSPEQMVSTSSDKKIGLDELQAHILGIIEVLNATIKQS